VGTGCVALFIFEMCERGIQLRNPFFSIWVTDLGSNLALTFIILAGISAGLYFIFLSYMIWQVRNSQSDEVRRRSEAIGPDGKIILLCTYIINSYMSCLKLVVPNSNTSLNHHASLLRQNLK